MFEDADSDNPVIILEREGLVACSKPPGMETISLDGAPDFTRTIHRLPGKAGLRPAHRLDRDTSGVQLFAADPAAEKELTELFKHRGIDKTYIAVCFGIPRNSRGQINRNLSKWSGGRAPVKVVKGGGGLTASTGYEVVAGNEAEGFEPGVSLVRFNPHQGRTHQIRVHASAFGYPILGDDQYGDRHANKLARDRFGLKRQGLHAWRLAFEWRGERLNIECRPPPDMLRAIQLAFGDKVAAMFGRSAL